MKLKWSFRHYLLSTLACLGMSQAWSDKVHPLVETAMVISAGLSEQEGRYWQYPENLRLNPRLPEFFRARQVQELQEQIDEELSKSKEKITYKVTEQDLTVFEDRSAGGLGLEGVRRLLMSLRQAIHKHSESVTSKSSDLGLAPLVRASVIYMGMLYRMHLLFARAAYNTVQMDLDPEDIRGKMSPQILQFSWEQLDASLVVSRRAGLLLIGELAEFKVPTKARHLNNGDSPNLDIEFVLTEEQKQFAEFLVLSRDPSDWTLDFLNSRTGTGKYNTEEMSRDQNLYSFRTPEAYARILQFVAIRESLINRYSLNRMFETPVAEKSVQYCGPGFLSLRPEEGLVRKSAAYQELAANDRWNVFNEKLPDLNKLVSDRPIFSPQQSGKLIVDFAALHQKEISLEDQDTYDMELLAIGQKNVQVENALFDDKRESIVKLSSLNGDNLETDLVAQRLANIAFRFRADAHKKVIRENLMKDTPALKAQDIDAFLDKALKKKKAGYIAALKEALKAPLAEMSKQTSPKQIATEAYESKINQLRKALAASGPAAWELMKIKSMSVSDKRKPVSALYRNQINDPAFLKMFFDAKKNDHEVFAKAWRHKEIVAEVDAFFGEITRRFENAPEPDPSTGVEKLAQVVSEVATEYANQYPYDRIGVQLKEASYVKVDGVRVENPKLTAYDKRKIYTMEEGFDAVFKALNILPRKVSKEIEVYDPKLKKNVKKWNESWAVNIKKNAAFTPTYNDHELLNSFIVALAEKGNVLLGSTWQVNPYQNPYLSDEGPSQYYGWGRRSHYEMRDHSVVQQVGIFAYNPNTGALDDAVVRRILKTALKKAHTAAGGLVEDFCGINPLMYATSDQFGKLFHAMSGTRAALANGNREITMMDMEMSKHFRTTAEKIQQDIIAPMYGNIGMLLLVGIAIGLLTPVVPMLAPLAAAFTWSTASGVILNSSFVAMATLNLAFNTTTKLIDAPARAAYTTQVAQSQVGDGETISSWSAVRAERAQVEKGVKTWAITSIMEVYAVASMGPKALSALKKLFPAPTQVTFSVQPGPVVGGVSDYSGYRVTSKLEDKLKAFGGYIKRLGKPKPNPGY
ncbi:MAG: hypothetical protein JNL01_01220 [Bdellovibrionales bacterium]|nr:hypothetical protein [Bdellovibrionales bacterium]